MQFTLTIDCDTAAFHDASNDELHDGPLDDYRRRMEVARILQVAAVLIAGHAEDRYDLLDIHGKRVGSFDFLSA